MHDAIQEKKHVFRIIIVWFCLWGCVFLTGCTIGQQAPDFLIFNYYFPSWLVGAMVAAPITVLVRVGLVKLGLDDFLPFRFFTYMGIWLLISLGFYYLYSPR